MTFFRFLHTADLHLGSPLQSAGRRFPESWTRLLREAVDTALTRIVDTAIEQRVEFVTIAGDLFDTDKAAMSAQFNLLRGFLRLQEAGVEVVVIHGNHDWLQGAQGPVTWPENVHVLGACERDPFGSDNETAPTVVLTTRDGSRVQVTGFSYTQSEHRRPMHGAFARLDEVDFAIGLYHGVVGDKGPHENYCPTSVVELCRRNFDFWGLGHIHQSQVLQADAPAIVYPGNPQGRHLREQGPRGCTLVTVEGRQQIELKFVSTASIIWQNVSVDVEGCDNVSDVLLRCLEEIQKQGPGGSERAIVVIVMTGSTRLHHWLYNDSDVIDNLMDELMMRMSSVLVADMQVRTTPEADLKGLEESPEFIGEFLRLCSWYLNNPREARSELSPLLAEVFHSGNSLAVDNLSDEALLEFIIQARGHVLGYVGEEGSR